MNSVIIKNIKTIFMTEILESNVLFEDYHYSNNSVLYCLREEDVIFRIEIWRDRFVINYTEIKDEFTLYNMIRDIYKNFINN